MTTPVPGLVRTTRPLLPETLATLARLKPGDRISITQTVRITSTRSWTTTVVGTFRRLQCLITGLATDRRAQDDIIVPTVHFTKDNGELSSVAVDEETRIELLTATMDPLDPKTEFTVAQFERAIAKNPEDQRAFVNMGLWWHWKGEYSKALEHYNEAIRLSPTFACALSARASLRATCPNPTWRDGNAALDDATKAMQYAKAAGEMDGSWKQRQYLQVLAAAHAECGDFAEAVRCQTAALNLAITKAFAREIRARLAVYESGNPARMDRGLVRHGVSEWAAAK